MSLLRRARDMSCVGSSSAPRARRTLVAGRARSDLVRARVIEPWERMQPVLYQRMRDGEIGSVSPGNFDESECVVVDVRLSQDFEDVHAKDAQSVPIFRSITSWNFKRVLYELNGVKGVEEDPDFISKVVSLVRSTNEAKGKKMTYLFMCDGGGTAQPVPGFLLGKQSRSLQALYRVLIESGLSEDELKVGHMEGGLRGWAGDFEKDIEGENTDIWKEKATKIPT